MQNLSKSRRLNWHPFTKTPSLTCGSTALFLSLSAAFGPVALSAPKVAEPISNSADAVSSEPHLTAEWTVSSLDLLSTDVDSSKAINDAQNYVESISLESADDTPPRIAASNGSQSGFKTQPIETVTAHDLYESEEARAKDLAPIFSPNTEPRLFSQVPEPSPDALEPIESEDSPASEEQPTVESDSDPGTDSEAEEQNTEEDYKYGQNGQGRWFVQGGLAIPYNPDNSNIYGLAGLGFTHFFADGHSISGIVNALAFSQVGSDAVGINLDLIARWHFLRQRTWSLFIDGGAGILGTTSKVPLIGGSRFNFTPQVGGGVSFNIAKKRRMMVGVRWHHISNANLFPPNPGQDAVLGWVSIDLPW